MAEFSDLKGKFLKHIEVDKEHEEIFFVTTDNQVFRMYHEQDCCESVYIEDICGELSLLIGKQIVLAEEATNSESSDWDSTTWTFYRIATMEGLVTIRWCGTSNGYYSESVDFAKIDPIFCDGCEYRTRREETDGIQLYLCRKSSSRDNVIGVSIRWEEEHEISKHGKLSHFCYFRKFF